MVSYYELVVQGFRRFAGQDAEPEPQPEPESVPAAPEPQETVAAVPLQPGPVDPAPEPLASPARFDAAAIAELCTAAGMPSLTAVLVRAGVTDAAEVRDRIDTAAETHRIVRTAHRMQEAIPLTLADVLIAGGVSLATTKEIIGVALVTHQSPEINGMRSADGDRDHDWGNVYEKAAREKAKAN